MSKHRKNWTTIAGVLLAPIVVYYSLVQGVSSAGENKPVRVDVDSVTDKPGTAARLGWPFGGVIDSTEQPAMPNTPPNGE